MLALALIALVLVPANACADETGTSFERASRAAARSRMHEAAELYALAARNDADPEKRRDAELRLANIEWRVFHDFAAARNRLQTMNSADAHIELARIATEQKDYATARTEARKAIAAATKKNERVRATIALARAIAEDERSEAAEVRETIASLRSVIAAEGPRLDAARLLTRVALRAGDGAAALEGINGYYHVSAFSEAPGAIAASHAALARMLPSWNGAAEQRVELAKELAGIRFFDEAAIVAPSSDVAAYAMAMKRLEDATHEYYRQIALGNESARVLRKAVKREAPDEKLLARNFGTYINIGETGDHIDLHMGHVVVDRNDVVKQYGKSASVRFVALDSMVSNGYSEWLNDDRSGDGGWATETEIYQVRPRYANGPLREWALLMDDEARAEDEKKTAAETARDIARAKENPIQSFAGLTLRLRRQYLQSVLAELEAEHLEGASLRDAFLARVESEHFTSSILLHEGRHAIDRLSKQRFATWELEYRAKLSEIALAPSPREALGSVLDFDIGGDSPHGKATEKLATGLVAWMQQHRPDIAGYDPAFAPLPQIDRLTDEQIRTAVSSLDPLAR